MLSRVIATGLFLCAALAGPVEAAVTDDLAEVTRLHHAGQTAAALERADRALAANPKDAQMRFLKSVLLADSGRSDEARAMLEGMVQEFPELPEPHNNLAALQAASGEYGKARAELEEAIRLNPSYAPAYENLGDVEAMLAAQSYARALRLEPTSTSLPKKLALVRELATPVAAPGAAAAAPASQPGAQRARR